MKKLIALFVALIMAAAVAPAALANPVSADDISVTYTGQTVNAANVNVGGNFTFTLSVSENTCMWSGHWLIDYPEEYVTPINYTTTWSGGIIYQVNQTYDEGEPWSDIPEFVCMLSYEGMTGGNPYGEAGNFYTVVGMYLMSFDFGGMQMGGNIIRVTYRLDNLPNAADIEHDAAGYYMPFPITVRESRYWVPGSQIGVGNYYLTHENITVNDGKVYVKATHTVTFYDHNGEEIASQEVIHGQAAEAPEAPAYYIDQNGPYVFYGWDADFSSVTQDIEAHALYTLLGDVNFDGVVDSVDALMALRASMGIIELNARETAAADIDMNNNVLSDDALIILRYAMGIMDSLI